NWQRADRWPGVRAPVASWYLAEGAGGALALSSAVAEAARSAFRVDYDVGASEYFAFWVDSQHGRGLSFTSEPLSRDHTLIGYRVVRLPVRSDQPEPVVCAYLEKPAPDGAAWVIAFGRLGAAYRKTGAAPYDTLGLPWHTGLEADHAPLV